MEKEIGLLLCALASKIIMGIVIVKPINLHLWVLIGLIESPLFIYVFIFYGIWYALIIFSVVFLIIVLCYFISEMVLSEYINDRLKEM